MRSVRCHLLCTLSVAPPAEQRDPAAQVVAGGAPDRSGAEHREQPLLQGALRLSVLVARRPVRAILLVGYAPFTVGLTRRVDSTWAVWVDSWQSGLVCRRPRALRKESVLVTFAKKVLKAP